MQDIGSCWGVLAYWGQTPESGCAGHWIMDGLALPLVEAYSFDETGSCVLNRSRTKIIPLRTSEVFSEGFRSDIGGPGYSRLKNDAGASFCWVLSM